jgi:dolichyl-phosphate-mannose--protein O-mannosyl transferase
MKVYVTTTGVIFGLLTVAHVWRVIAEGPHLARGPAYILFTVGAAALCLWAFRLLWLARRRPL